MLKACLRPFALLFFPYHFEPIAPPDRGHREQHLLVIPLRLLEIITGIMFGTSKSIITRRRLAHVASIATMTRLMTGSPTLANGVRHGLASIIDLAIPFHDAVFNQTYVTLDAITAAAVVTSPLLRDVASVTVASGSTRANNQVEAFTGRYINMRDTLLEIFAPGDNLTDAPRVGCFGIILGADRPGLLRQVADRLNAAGYPATVQLQKRGTGPQAPDWLYDLELSDVPSASLQPTNIARAFGLEYVASYFERPGHPVTPSLGPSDQISRRRYQAHAYKNALFQNLIAGTYAVDRSLYEKNLRPVLAAYGFLFQEDNVGAICTGSDIQLRFDFSTLSQTGLREWIITLSEPVDGSRSETIGRSRLTVGPGTRARWSFDRA